MEKVMGPLMFVEALERELEAREGEATFSRERAETKASVAHSLGVRAEDMTETQASFVEEVHRKRRTGVIDDGSYGFRIPTEDRDPQVK